MKRNTSIKLKAAFLLVAFALNTIAGFACAVGLDVGFNSKHHHDKEATEPVVVHIHKGGERHIHHEKKETHKHNKSHHHEEADKNPNSNSDKDNCCNKIVRNFEQLDKLGVNSAISSHPAFFAAFLSPFYNVNLLRASDVVIDIKPFVRSYHPPISDIRIAIQSFQI